MLLRTLAKSRAHEVTAQRDRTIDAIRALSLLLVVVGHTVMGMVYWSENNVVLGNLLAIDTRLHWLTWLFQIMPVFFIAGGAANFLSIQSKDITYSTWLYKRISRLLSPTLTYLAIMIVLGWGLGYIFNDSFMRIYLLMVTQLLWFLGVYILCTALFPLLLKVPRYIGVVVLILAVVSIDILRFQLNEVLGILNFLFVWLLIMLMGTFFVRPLSKIFNLIAFFLLLATELLLVLNGIYPVSLVGLPSDEFSNVAPPTVLMALHGMLFLTILSLTKPLISHLSTRERIWNSVVSINAGAMTIYLWHIPMIMTVALALQGLSLSPATSLEGTIVMPEAGFWNATVLYWLFAFAAIYLFVQIIWPLEHLRIPVLDAKPSENKAWWRTLLASSSVILSGFGLLGLAGSGLYGFPSRIVNFAGFSYTNGLAVTLFLSGIVVLRLSVANYSVKSPR